MLIKRKVNYGNTLVYSIAVGFECHNLEATYCAYKTLDCINILYILQIRKRHNEVLEFKNI